MRATHSESGFRSVWMENKKANSPNKSLNPLICLSFSPALTYGTVEVKITSFASKVNNEGRVDNHIIEFTSPDGIPSDEQPAIKIRSDRKITVENTDTSALPRKQVGIISHDGAVLAIVDSPARLETKGKDTMVILSVENNSQSRNR